VQSTPPIRSNQRLCGVFSTHFCEPQFEGPFDRAQLNQLAVQLTDGLEQRESLAPSRYFVVKRVPKEPKSER
jgi:hypothetical protein